MLEPQSTALFILLMAVFFALLAWVAVARQPVIRVFAAALAFVPAMLFGVAAVNKYYDYYQTWGSVASDLGGQSLNTASIPQDVSTQSLTAILGKVTSGKLAAQQGETVRLQVPGAFSHITRTAYVYLPPQYFQAKYRHYRFPAIELLNGFPGQPQDWINVVGITQSYQALLSDGTDKPAVLVMPDPNGAPRVSLQCLNVYHGPQDATFLAVDLENYLYKQLRVVPSGRAWGIAGYSEGGYCAANLALQYPYRFGYSGVMSGYFRPERDRLGNPPRRVNAFGNSTKLRLANSPLYHVSAIPVSVHFAKFWLGAGSGNVQDVRAVMAFQQALIPRQPNVVVHWAAGGGHSMATWRALVPPMLAWMTPKLAAEAPLWQQPHTAPAPVASASPKARVSPKARATVSPSAGQPKPRPSGSASPKA